MNNCKIYIKFFFVFSFSFFLLASCTSIKQPAKVFEVEDYTEEDVKREEIKRIEKLLETNNMQALWRATLVGDDEIIQKCSDSLVADYDKFIEEKNWYEARKIYKSLESISYNNLYELKPDGKELDELFVENVPGLKKIQAKLDKVSSYINGTLTVWVDKGMTVKNGMGYADRVIGSGFFISNDGYIITNHHVIADIVDTKYEGYARLYVKLAEDNETRIPAKVIGWDPLIDLALLKVELNASYVFNLGSSAGLDVGDKVYAIGSPIGLERTLTSGIVSSTDRKLFSLGSVMQIDAAVNSGNSGGPCIDEDGNVQAIVFAGMLQYEGLNFAIPVEYLKDLLPALYSGGKILHPWIGAYGHTKKENGVDMGLEIQYVMPGGSASRARLSAGDVITGIAGEPVYKLEDMQRVLMKNSAKSIVKLRYKTSSGEEKSCSIYLATRTENPGYIVYKNDIIAHSFLPIYGMNLISVSSTGKRRYTIESVIRGSVADESGFSENDPVEVRDVQFNEDKTAIYSEIYAKNRKKGYLDVSMAVVAPLDSPYYF